MGKRIAENQLTQDNFNDDVDDDQAYEGKDFTKAAPEQLSARKIKALPNRRSGSSTPVTTPKVTTENQQFQLPKTANDQASTNIYVALRGLNLSVLDTIQSLIDQDAFVDLGDKLLSIAATYSTERSRISNNRQTITQPVSSKALPAASAAPAAPTFTFGQAAQPSLPTTTSSSSAKPAPFAGFSFGSAPAAVQPKPKPDGPPAVPTNGFTFGGKVMGTPEAANSVKSTSSTTPSNSFVFDASKVSKSAEKSPFSFPVQAPAAKSTTPASELEIPKPAPINIPTRPSPLRESSHVDSPPSASKPQQAEIPSEKAKVNPFAAFGGFGNTSTPPAKPAQAASSASTIANPFKNLPATQSSTEKLPTPAFGSALSGTSSSSQPTFSFGSTNTPAKDAAPTFSFGGGSTSSAKSLPQFTFGAHKPATSDATPSPTFSFGTAAPKVPSTSGSVGFTFGSSTSPFAATSKTTSEAKPAPAAFSFTPPTHTPSASSSKAPSEGGEEEQPETMEPTLPTSGEGEEDEEILYEARAAVYVMDPAGPKWTNKGVTLLKVKEAKTTGKKRVLARLATTTSGSIVLNFNIPPGWKAEASGKEVSFMGFFGEENKAVKAKVKTPEKATELAEALTDAAS